MNEKECERERVNEKERERKMKELKALTAGKYYQDVWLLYKECFRFFAK